MRAPQDMIAGSGIATAILATLTLAASTACSPHAGPAEAIAAVTQARGQETMPAAVAVSETELRRTPELISPTASRHGSEEATAAAAYGSHVDALDAATPGGGWTPASAASSDGERVFSVMPPQGWEREPGQEELSFQGVVAGNGIALRHEYSRYSHGPDPNVDPHNEYMVRLEEIGGLDARLMLDASPPDKRGDGQRAVTSVYFTDLGQLGKLVIFGRGLNRAQQKTALAIFRNIRALRDTASDGQAPVQSAVVPPAPKNLAAVVTDGWPWRPRAVVRLSWTPPADAAAYSITGYKVERSEGDIVSLLGTTDRSTTTFSDESAELGRTYVYRVFAENAAGDGQPAALETEVSSRIAAPAGVPIRFTAQSAIREARVLRPPDGSGDYRLLVISGRSSGSCTAFGGHELRRTDSFSFAVKIFHYVTAGARTRCTMDWITDRHIVQLGSGFQAGDEHTITVNGDTAVSFVPR